MGGSGNPQYIGVLLIFIPSNVLITFSLTYFVNYYYPFAIRLGEKSIGDQRLM